MPEKQELDNFHRHLDGCERCGSQPFNLCPVGNELLSLACQVIAVVEVGRASKDNH